MKEGWEYIALSSVCKVQNGFAFNSKLFNETNNGLPLVRIRDIKRGYSLTYTYEACSNDFYVEDGDMLIGMDGDFNIGEWKGGHALLNQRVCKLIPSEKILAKFIFYFIPEALQRINDKTAFSTVKHLSSKQINAILLPNLPLSEQQSIVDYLDSAFAKIDAMKANAEKALNEAKALFQASLKEMLEPKEGWEEKTLGEILNLRRGHDLTHSQMTGSDYPVAGSNGQIGTHNCCTPISPCITVGRSGSVGAVNIYKECWAHNTTLYIDDFKGNYPRYLYYLLKSLDLVHLNSGSAVPTLNRNFIHPLKISYIRDINVQQSIVETLDSLKSKVDRLQENYDKISQECDALKQAILRQVFE